jgi:hypothetical protein
MRDHDNESLRAIARVIGIECWINEEYIMRKLRNLTTAST